MRYAKLNDGALVYAPTHGKCKADGRYYYPLKAPQWEADGYKPVVETRMPESGDGEGYTAAWEERNGEIVQIWTAETEVAADAE